MKRKVLLVDDCPSILSGLRRALHKEAFETHVESSGAAGLKRIEDDRFDVIVSDHDMPGMDGATFLAEVQKFDASIVRFMLTGKATLDMTIKAINQGTVDQFFTKPCDHLELSMAIHRALEHKDLLADSRKLLHKFHLHQAELERFKQQHSKLLTVDRDDSGAILLEDLPMDGPELRRLMGEAINPK
jgi:DNA-binding NtrC family response regulator